MVDSHYSAIYGWLRENLLSSSNYDSAYYCCVGIIKSFTLIYIEGKIFMIILIVNLFHNDHFSLF